MKGESLSVMFGLLHTRGENFPFPEGAVCTSLAPEDVRSEERNQAEHCSINVNSFNLEVGEVLVLLTELCHTHSGLCTWQSLGSGLWTASTSRILPSASWGLWWARDKGPQALACCSA